MATQIDSRGLFTEFKRGMKIFPEKEKTRLGKLCIKNIAELFDNKEANGGVVGSDVGSNFGQEKRTKEEKNNSKFSQFKLIQVRCKLIIIIIGKQNRRGTSTQASDENTHTILKKTH